MLAALTLVANLALYFYFFQQYHEFYVCCCVSLNIMAYVSSLFTF
jgi:hypothetical protein